MFLLLLPMFRLACKSSAFDALGTVHQITAVWSLGACPIASLAVGPLVLAVLRALASTVAPESPDSGIDVPREKKRLLRVGRISSLESSGVLVQVRPQQPVMHTKHAVVQKQRKVNQKIISEYQLSNTLMI